MDQFSAHLDRGWDLVQRGDAAGAESSARRALELDGDSPEAYNLLGFAAALAGDYEEAAEHYRQAIALDDCYLEALLNAAELCIHPLGEFEEAERLCDDALELADDAEERVDALLLKFDALLGQGNTEAARVLCQRLPLGPFENPAHTFLTGRALFEVGEPQKAEPLLEAAVTATPENAEAFYYLGLLRDEQSKPELALAAFVRTRELDILAPAPAFALSLDAFKNAVASAVEGIEPNLRELIGEREVFVDALPGIEVVADGVDPRALLLIDSLELMAGAGPDHAEGKSFPVRATEPRPGSLRLFVYQQNVERMLGGVEQLVTELTLAIGQELEAHLKHLEAAAAADTPAQGE
jgi:Flp pilus assembly protein TadD